MSSDNSLGVFEEQVMLAVLHARDDAYGMNVRREIETRTDREVAIGAVYATLDRLEQKGLIASTRVAGDGGSRRVFSVTAAGTRVLQTVGNVPDAKRVAQEAMRLARDKGSLVGVGAAHGLLETLEAGERGAGRVSAWPGVE